MQKRIHPEVTLAAFVLAVFAFAYYGMRPTSRWDSRDINAKETRGFGLTRLHNAVWNGNVEEVKRLLARKADPNVLDENNRTPLHFADSKETIQLLLDHGAAINRGYPILLSQSRPELLEFLLSRGANPNAQDLNGATRLHHAILSRNSNVVDMLLRYHPNLKLKDHQYGTPVSIAVERGHVGIALSILNAVLEGESNTVHSAAAAGATDILRVLLSKNPELVRAADDLGFTPLHWAAEAGQQNAADLLIEFGAPLEMEDTAGFRPLDWAAFMGRLPLVQLLVSKSGRSRLPQNHLDRPLLFATQQNHPQIARFLLEHGADINARKPFGQAPLHLAASRGNVEMIRLLLEFQVPLEPVDINRTTPLQSAIYGTSPETVRLLLSSGADASVKTGEMTLFHEWALGAGDPQIAELLRAHKLDLNAKDSDGKTPLHHAAHQGQKQAVEWLLTHGADVNARDNHNVTPLRMLRNRRTVRRKDIAELLRSHGGNE